MRAQRLDLRRERRDRLRRGCRRRGRLALRLFGGGDAVGDATQLGECGLQRLAVGLEALAQRRVARALVILERLQVYRDRLELVGEVTVCFCVFSWRKSCRCSGERVSPERRVLCDFGGPRRGLGSDLAVG